MIQKIVKPLFLAILILSTTSSIFGASIDFDNASKFCSQTVLEKADLSQKQKELLDLLLQMDNDDLNRFIARALDTENDFLDLKLPPHKLLLEMDGNDLDSVIHLVQLLRVEKKLSDRTVEQGPSPHRRT